MITSDELVRRAIELQARAESDLREAIKQLAGFGFGVDDIERDHQRDALRDRGIMTNEARSYWRQKSQNFMTPNVLGYRTLSNQLLVELSSGTGMDHEPIFGVSVARDGAYDEELSRLFWNRDEAESYIKTLEEE